MSRTVITLPVSELIGATPSTRLVRLALGDETFAYHAGQAAFIGIHGQASRKPYSIASAPEEAAKHGRLEFLLKVDGDGPAATHLEGLTEGALVDVDGPLGSFRFPETTTERRFLFVAGGTGIAPLRAMLWHVLETLPDAIVSVLYSVRTPSDFAYGDQLRELARQGRITLRMTVTREADETWADERGRIDKERLAALLTDPATLCFVCGPESLVHSLPRLLRELGVADGRIRTEEW